MDQGLFLVVGIVFQRLFRALLFSAPHFRRSQVSEQERAQKSLDYLHNGTDSVFGSPLMFSNGRTATELSLPRLSGPPRSTADARR